MSTSGATCSKSLGHSWWAQDKEFGSKSQEQWHCTKNNKLRNIRIWYWKSWCSTFITVFYKRDSWLGSLWVVCAYHCLPQSSDSRIWSSGKPFCKIPIYFSYECFLSWMYDSSKVALCINKFTYFIFLHLHLHFYIYIFIFI